MSVVIALLLADVATALEADPALAERFRALLATTSATQPDLFVRAKDSGLAPGTRKRLVQQGKLTKHLVGRELFFLKAEVDAYIASRAVLRPAPLPDEGDEVDRAMARKKGKR